MNFRPHQALHDFPHVVPIKAIVRETPQVRRYILPVSVGAKPGQFINVWIPGIDEKPMSVSFDDGKELTLAVAAVGTATKELERMKVGDFIGVRGPYGTHFTWKKKQRIAMIAGGYGAGPLWFCATKAVKDGCAVDVFLGARKREFLLFPKEIKKVKNTKLFTATDDGSSGFRGTNVACWQEQMVRGARYDAVMTVGPELMMRAVSDICFKKKIPAQISLERYMKCGFGVCGNCCVDDLGIPSCQEGTVMSNQTVRGIKEFGIYHRDSVGEKHYF